MPPGLRKIIEKRIGREILDKYCHSSTNGPIMIPPIPDSKFLEKFPEGKLEGKAAAYKELQDGYEAEVKVYRCFEELKRNVIVIHQIEYTHQQYSAFVPQHNCNKKRCNQEREVHPCHQYDKDVEMENDFVVIGPDFVAVFEVKGLSVCKYQTCCSELISRCSIKRNGIKSSAQERNADKFEGCSKDAARQRNRMVNLVKHLNGSVQVYQFTIFPNISREEVDEGYLSDTSLVFSEDFKNFASWFDANIPSSDTDLDSITKAMKSVKRSLLGLWCISKDNKWDISNCNLSKGIMDVNTKLKKALVTQQAIDQDKSQAIDQDKSKKKLQKQKTYSENPEMVKAPNLFKDYLNISCLTPDQLDVFNSEERFLWVEGPAGSGKTITMLGKIIDIVTSKKKDRVLVMNFGMKISPAALRYYEVLNNIREDITCTIVEYDYCSESEDDLDDKVYDAETSLDDQLIKARRSRIVILALYKSFVPRSCFSIYKRITSFNYMFIDDCQRLPDSIIRDHTFDNCKENLIYTPYKIYHQEPPDTSDILVEVLLPVVKFSSTNNTSLWVFCDNGQSVYVNYLRDKENMELDGILKEFKAMFKIPKLLSVNLRNTHEGSAVLSVIRNHYNTMEYSDKGTLRLPQQKNGHFLRGTKPTIYLLRDDNLANCIGILEKELFKLTGPGSRIDDKDIAVFCSTDNYDAQEIKYRLHKRLNTKIAVRFLGDSVSGEWPAVVHICRYTSFKNTLKFVYKRPENSIKEIEYSYAIPLLYQALSRARVYSTAIIYGYIPNTCKYTDKMLSELRERTDICRILD